MNKEDTIKSQLEELVDDFGLVDLKKNYADEANGNELVWTYPDSETEVSFGIDFIKNDDFIGEFKKLFEAVKEYIKGLGCSGKVEFKEQLYAYIIVGTIKGI